MENSGVKLRCSTTETDFLFERFKQIYHIHCYFFFLLCFALFHAVEKITLLLLEILIKFSFTPRSIKIIIFSGKSFSF